MAHIIRAPRSPEEQAFQERIDLVWASCQKVDKQISRAWVETLLRKVEVSKLSIEAALRDVDSETAFGRVRIVGAGVFDVEE